MTVRNKGSLYELQAQPGNCFISGPAAVFRTVIFNINDHERGCIMLSNVKLDRKMGKKEYKRIMDELEPRAAFLQREAKALGLPVLVVFEGWDAAGKGTLINRFIQPLDPRGFKVFTIKSETELERMHPYMWRFWTNTPEKGRMHIFDGSWYNKVLSENVNSQNQGRVVPYYQRILSFEEQLTADGNLIIKFFLHISKEEQEKRLKKLDDAPETTWRVTKTDWDHHRLYDNYMDAYNLMIEHTDVSYAPWNIIEATDRRYATVKVLSTFIDLMERRIKEINEMKENQEAAQKNITEKPETAEENPASITDELRTSVLSGADLTKTLSEKAYKKRIDELQDEMEVLHSQLYRRRIPVVIALEGWDAGGKGGAIKRLTEKMDPRGYEVVPTASPNDIEKMHHYLWRFWVRMPKDGHVAIFDRTWYGRVMVERIEGFCSEEEWRRAYKEINQMEADLYAHGAIVLKFWMHIDKEEQERRFNDRLNNPDKQWKITDEDWRNRDKWEEYERAVDEMILRTSTSYAPWTVVEGNSKYYARVKVLETVVNAIKERLEKEQ